MAEAFIGVRAEDLDDRALVERFKRTGDPAWFGLLFERHQRWIYALCYTLVENRTLAEDLVQETFMRALQQIDRFNEQDPVSRFVSWLRPICRNLCLSELRKIKRQRDYEASVRRQTVRRRQMSETVLLLHQLGDELDALEEEVRRCWLLFYVDGYTYQEIAHLTGYSFQRVKSYLRAVRRRLRKR